MSEQRERIQIDMPKAIQIRAKTVASSRNIPLVQLILLGLTKVGDKELAEQIEDYMAEKTKPGRPQK